MITFNKIKEIRRMSKKEQTYEEWYASCQPINWSEETTKLFSSGDTFSEKDVKPKND
jgi:hypothetical protein